MNVASCIVPGCNKTQYGRGICAMHTYRFKHYGTYDPQVTISSLPDEVWLPVKGLEKRFLISNFGRLQSLPSKNGFGCLRKQWHDKLGYCYISYRNTGKTGGKTTKVLTHRAVAEAFIPNPANKPVVNHLDNNPSNNHYLNLEWATVRENVYHAIKQGRMNLEQNRGEKSGLHKLTELQVLEIKKLKGLVSGIQAANRYSVGDQTIYDIWNGRRWKHVR